MLNLRSRAVVGLIGVLGTMGTCLAGDAEVHEQSPAWRSDPVWHEGKAEWAYYSAQRDIYGETRHYHTTIFTNTEHVDPESRTKAEDWKAPGMVPVFKHTISQIIPTDNYDYRFLSSGYVRADVFSPYKLTSTSQEDCGTSFREFTIDRRVRAIQSCYFPGTGWSEATYPADDALAFHDLMSLTLRDYPFESQDKPTLTIERVPSQENNQQTLLKPAPATIEYVGRETIEVPFGKIDTHRLRVRHEEDGGATESHYWFAADPEMRHVLVKYHGPYEVRWRLERLGWWAYWEESKPRQSNGEDENQVEDESSCNDSRNMLEHR